jgi:DNA-binding response OmpR family regulator
MASEGEAAFTPLQVFRKAELQVLDKEEEMSKRILVVDDDCYLQHSLQDLLEDEGYEVDTASDGLVALEKLAQSHSLYDVILLDLTMPRLDGLQLLQILQRQAWGSFSSIIVTSGDSVALHQATRMGTKQALRKPYDPDVLLNLVACSAA